MSIDISAKKGPGGTHRVIIGNGKAVLHVELEDVANVQARLTEAVMDAHRLDCEEKVTPPPASKTMVSPMTSLRWVREGTGSHTYSALAPGGVQLTVRLNGGSWVALIDNKEIGEYPKKRQAQVICEQRVSTNGNGDVTFLEAK